MHKLLVSIFLLMAFSSCANNKPSFTKMSYEEVVAYNATVDISEQVYCREELRAGTHIKRRYCETIADYEARMHSIIGTLNSANLGSTINFSVD